MALAKKVNGINVDQLFSTIEQIKGNPEIAKFKFRAVNMWIEGTHNRATVKDLSDGQKEELIKMAQKYSPVFNSVAKPVPVSVQLDKK
jgi:hypothetical protein